MSVKKNFIFNSILLVSQYIVPLIIFPHISRVFGVEKIGLANFVDSYVNYFILFSTLGLTLTGIRETAKKRKDRAELSKVFSELLLLHLILTLILLVVYIVSILAFAKFREHEGLYWIGISKLLFNVFLIEWFYRGMENFKYITLRSIGAKILYVVLVLLFVRHKGDLPIYYALTCVVIVVNGLINCWYARNFISLVFRGINLKQHFNSLIAIGIYLLLTSMYTSFNVVFLGMVSTNVSVGYYTTSLKLYTIILGMFTALNEVMMPRLSTLIAENNKVAFDALIQKSILYVSTLCFPVIMVGLVLAPQIIAVIAGPGYDGSVMCFRIILPLMFVIGIAQIFANQILMSIKRDKELSIVSFVGAVLGLGLSVLLVPKFHEVGTAIVVLSTEAVVTGVLYFFCYKYAETVLPLGGMFFNLIVSIPYLLISFLCEMYLSKNVEILCVGAILALIYFILSQVYLIKNELIIVQLSKIRNRVAVFTN